MGAEYVSYMKSIATFAPTFYGYIISILSSVAREAVVLGIVQKMTFLPYIEKPSKPS